MVRVEVNGSIGKASPINVTNLGFPLYMILYYEKKRDLISSSWPSSIKSVVNSPSLVPT